MRDSSACRSTCLYDRCEPAYAVGLMAMSMPSRCGRRCRTFVMGLEPYLTSAAGVRTSECSESDMPLHQCWHTRRLDRQLVMSRKLPIACRIKGTTGRPSASRQCILQTKTNKNNQSYDMQHGVLVPLPSHYHDKVIQQMQPRTNSVAGDSEGSL